MITNEIDLGGRASVCTLDVKLRYQTALIAFYKTYKDEAILTKGANFKVMAAAAGGEVLKVSETFRR